MARRAYRLGRRAESAAATRQRLVEATFALHSERGVLATSMKDIAARADVSVGTVYHHFPTYDDAIQACGQHVLAVTRPPTPAIFDDCRSRAERMARLAEALFAFYERFPSLEGARAERARVPLLDGWIRRWEDGVAALARLALGEADIGRQRMVIALTDIAVWRTLTAGGLSTEDAAAEIACLIHGWLKRPAGRATTNPPSKRG
ncbi:MAG: TetR/AcrR family transcriptional regulator [Alphaproteobacteria bacterium]|nr:TetR/AcrR family transcriptional regulator [Alphaproteobacteria bacterium]